MNATTLTLTIASLVFSLLSVVFTGLTAWWTWRAWARRLRVRALFGLGGRGGVASSTKVPEPRELERLIDQGYQDPLIGVEVRNTGVSPITVEKWSIDGGTTVLITPIADQIGPNLPHTIPGGSSATWWTPFENVRSLHVASSDVLSKRVESVRAVVELGDGHVTRSPKMAVANVLP